ncbi:MAG TPA: methyltransferase domain-containing protein, partial [Actinomycetales bacterium]
MSALSQVADVFDRVADTYDGVGVPWFAPIAHALVDELAPAAGERVAELGSGRGAATLLLAEAVGPSGQVDALDLAPRMVELLAAEPVWLVRHLLALGPWPWRAAYLDALPAAQRERILQARPAALADAAEPGLAAGSYDVVAASLVLFFLPDPAAAARAWAQLLVPGGRLGVTTFGPLDPLWQRVDALFTPYLPPRLLDARTSGRRGPFADDAGV